MELKLCPAVRKAMELIENHGYEVYVVGGAIRDYLLGRPYKDLDLATNASLSELKVIFKEYKIIEYKKGHTLGIVMDSEYTEVSAYTGYCIAEDLKNRDFSINSMAYHPLKGLLDPYGGRKDLKDKVLKTVRSPAFVMKEDPVRLLRAIRFHAVYGFSVESGLNRILLTEYAELQRVNPERLAKEIEYIFLTERPSGFIRTYFGVFSTVFPPLKATYSFQQHSKWHHLDVFEHIMAVMDATKPNLVLRYAAFFHDIEKPATFTLDQSGIGHFYNHYIHSAETAQRELSRLKYPKEFIRRVYTLVLYHDRPLEKNRRVILRFLHDFKTADLDLYFNLKKADILAQNPDLRYRLSEMEEIEVLTGRLLDESVFTVNQLDIRGTQLKKLGFESEEIKNMLEELLELVMDGRLPNEKERLINYAMERRR